jgi:uncharacterized protein DUF87
MRPAYQNVLTSAWNRVAARLLRRRTGPKLYFGSALQGGSVSRARIGIESKTRTEHIALLGKTGTGKTSLLRHLCAQDIRSGHGFAFFDLHGDTTPFLLGLIAEEEQRRGVDLSERTILIDPSDRERSVGLNILEAEDVQDAFVEISEVVDILRHRWRLDALGVRTDELLRHSLFVLVSNGLTFLEVTPLLTNGSFRHQCVHRTPLSEARTYFEARYDRLSAPMQAVYREAILNKVSLFAADPHFRHLLGQQESTLKLKQAVDNGSWVIFNLEKGRLGEEAATLGALLLAKLKHAILGRSTRRLFSLYCDELQNLVAYDAAIDVLLSEARKFGTSVVSANQYLDQYSVAMRSAVMAMGSHVFFQLSGLDAARTAHWLGGGKVLADRLRSLPRRHALFRSQSLVLTEFSIPELHLPTSLPVDLLRRTRVRWTRERSNIEEDIRVRHGAAADDGKDGLGDTWD